MLFILLGRAIGYPWTIVALVAVSVVGAVVVRREGARALSALSTAASSGRAPSGQVGESAFAVVGGLLMLVPGFLTGLVGLLFVVPVTRPVVRRAVHAAGEPWRADPRPRAVPELRTGRRTGRRTRLRTRLGPGETSSGARWSRARS